MRIALVAETSLLHMNGVTHSLVQMQRHLEHRGHDVRVIAPRGVGEVDGAALPGAEVELLRSVGLPSYPDVRLTFARAKRLEALLTDFAPDVVHLASPFVLGWQALRAADRLGIPTVAVYQTDVPAYAYRYGVAAIAPALTQHVGRIHRRATLTLAPSSASMAELASLGVDRMKLWARGVDAERFHPRRRSAAWRARHAPAGEVVIGYVGRLAPEKQVEDLAVLGDIPGTRLVIVGDGPARSSLEAAMPDAVFLGFQSGEELAESMASFDLFVHPGETETFCQTIQEAHASGVPVIATGRGGPLDLVESSRTGWLYRPGDLDELRARVLDLAGDDGKRRAFGLAAREAVAHRSWESLGDELLGHYRDAIRARRGIGTPVVGAPSRTAVAWKRYVALGDSITEGMCDSSRQSAGEFRGWADRLAMLLAHAEDRIDPLLYANLAVRGRRIDDVLGRQIPRALELRPDLVSVLIGGNDLAYSGWQPRRLADRLGRGLARLRATGADVLIVTPTLPQRPFLSLVHERTAVFARELARVAEETGCLLLDSEELRRDPRMWADDRVHLSSYGHRVLSYRAAVTLGLAGARELGDLDRAMHDDEPSELSTPAWLWSYGRPWMGRRMLRRTVGDGREPKHDALVPVIPAGPSGSPVRVED